MTAALLPDALRLLSVEAPNPRQAMSEDVEVPIWKEALSLSAERSRFLLTSSISGRARKGLFFFFHFFKSSFRFTLKIEW